MSLLKDAVIQAITKMPENTTDEDVIYELKKLKDEEDYLKFNNLSKIWKEETRLSSGGENLIYAHVIDVD